ncbi:MAG: hypothetical protein AAGC70_18660 [Pseudomonadota bacterium]
MVEALAFALTAYSAFADWPWWSALIFGAAAGLWTTRIRTLIWSRDSETVRFPAAGLQVVVGGMLLGAILCLMVYFAAQSIAQQA